MNAEAGMGWKKSPLGVLVALLTIHLMAHVDRNVLLGFSAQITRDLRLTNAQYGVLVGAVWVLSFGIMAVVMGSLADRFSRPRVIAAGILIWSVCTAASGHAHGFWQMVAARFMVASGEAALVPAAVGLLVELFSEKRRSTAIGLFFMGIPLGIGCSFLLAGSFGAAYGWRDTFSTLGLIGAAIAVPLLFLGETRQVVSPHPQGSPLLAQMRRVMAVIRGDAVIWQVMAGFVLVHVAFAGLSFDQLWLVRERGFDAATIARTIGLLQLLFGTLGSVLGGALGDGIARRLAGGHAGFMALLVLLCAPLIMACRFAAPGSVLFYIGLCAGFFLPLALYGPANTLIQGRTPGDLRSSISGVTMLLINVFAIAAGNAAAGAAVDYLSRQGLAAPMTWVLLATDALVLASIVFFLLTALNLRRGRQAVPAATGPAPLHFQ